MRKLWLLTKAQIVSYYTANQKGTSKRLGKLGVGANIALGVVLMAVISAFYGSMMAGEASLIRVNLTLFLSFILILTLITSVYMCKSMLVEPKDFNLLLSLPIPDSTYIAAKMLGCCVTTLLITIPFALPGAFLMGFSVGKGILFYVLLTIGVIFMTIATLSIGNIIGYFFLKWTIGTRYEKALQYILFLVLFFGGMLWSTAKDTIGKVMSFVPLLSWLVDGSFDGDVLKICGIIVISILAFVGFTLLFMRTFRQLVAKSKKVHTSVFTGNKGKALPLHRTLFMHDVKMFFGSVMYTMNFGLFAMMIIAACGYGVFKLADIRALLAELGPTQPLIITVLFLVLCAALSMANTTCVSISIEGEMLNTLKSLPIGVKSIFLSKLKLMGLIVGIPLLCVSLLALVAFDSYAWLIGLGFVYCVIVLFGVGVFGLIMNLLFPKLHWDNDAQVVKQSMSGFLGMVLPSAANGGLVALAFRLTEEMEYWQVWGMFAGLWVVLDIVLWVVLMKWGKKRFFEIG